jgi:hypothetical protein
MQDWYLQGFFNETLLVRRIEATDFETLGALVIRVGDASKPFLSNPAPRMYGPPACLASVNLSRFLPLLGGSPVLRCGRKATLILHLLSLNLYRKARAGMHPSPETWATILTYSHRVPCPKPTIPTSMRHSRNSEALLPL